MKRIITLLVVLATAFSMSAIAVSALAIEEEYSEKIINQPEMELFWVNTNSITLSMDFSGNIVVCSGRISGNANVNRITATFTLRRVNANGTLTTVRIWSGLSSNSRTLNFSGTFSTVSRGQTYRLEVVATLTTSNGVSETVRNSITRTY